MWRYFTFCDTPRFDFLNFWMVNYGARPSTTVNQSPGVSPEYIVVRHNSFCYAIVWWQSLSVSSRVALLALGQSYDWYILIKYYKLNIYLWLLNLWLACDDIFFCVLSMIIFVRIIWNRSTWLFASKFMATNVLISQLDGQELSVLPRDCAHIWISIMHKREQEKIC